MQTAIPFHFFRGGTSRGPFFNRADLPQDRAALAEVLIAAIGAGHPLNIDGIGGGAAVTTKVAMLSRADHRPDEDWAEIDYFFAQVAVTEREVDFKPTCGNMLSAVGPATIEIGLVQPQGDETRIRIRAVNTGARIEAIVKTPGGRVQYDGDTAIDGVPGTAAPVQLNFMDTAGSVCGSLLPTGNPRDVIDGVEVSMIDLAMPIMIVRAADLGVTGHESRDELDADTALIDRLLEMRREAGRRMGLGDVERSVMPKTAIIAPPRAGGAVTARYFMPWKCHPTMAVTGAQCLAACVLLPGTVAEGLAEAPAGNPALVRIEHPSGQIEVTVDLDETPQGRTIRAAGLVRTARLLARGEVMVPRMAWGG